MDRNSCFVEEREYEQYLRERAARKRKRMLREKRERERKIIIVLFFLIFIFIYFLFCMLSQFENQNIMAITIEEVPLDGKILSAPSVIIPETITDTSVTITQETNITETVTINVPYKYEITEDVKLLFMQIMAAESYQFWSYEDILSLATVVINRYNAPESEFPDDFYEILTQKKQFSTYANGRYLTANITDECRQAVEAALMGEVNLNSDVKYFCTKEYYESYPEDDFFKGLNHVYTVKNIYFFTN